MSTPSYAEYRTSDISPYGRLPSHWKQGAVRWFYIVSLGKMVTSSEAFEVRATRPYLRSANIQDGYIDFSDIKSMWFSDTEQSALDLRRGDLVVCEGGDAGRCAVLTEDLGEYGFQNSVNRVRPVSGSGVSTNFLRYWLKALKQAGWLDVICNRATIAHLTAEKLGAIKLPCPPPSEQRVIASFLDQETAKIDDLIAEQERLVGLLEEKRQAVISHVVTKGMDPTSLMKDSGIAWAGLIPNKWDTKPLRASYRFVKRQLGLGGDVLSVYRDFGVILKSSRDDNINKTPEDLSFYQTVHPGDLVINKMKAWQGSLGVSDLEGITSPDYAVFEPIGHIHFGYINWLLRCKLLPDVYRSISNGIRPDQWRLEPEKFKELKIPFPPTSEQADISEHLCRLGSGQQQLAQLSETAIALLRERRSALISAAVTGKIDVRGLVADTFPMREAAE